MLKDVKWAKTGTYLPGTKHDPIEFFTLALQNSSTFDLQLGYFNSAAISVLSLGFASFISRGGTMRMVINQIVSLKDKTAIESGLSDKYIRPFDLSDMERLKSILDSYSLHFFECLAYLIRNKRIEIKIVRPLGTNGIAHTKCGIFGDGELSIAFNGSANFTINGLLNNIEKIQLSFSNSPDEMVLNSIEEQQQSFDLLINEWATNVEYVDPSNLEVAIASEFGNSDINELLDVEKKLLEAKEKEILSTAVANDLEDDNPRFPYEKGPRDYQQLAFENWRSNKQKGLFAMATGTGKTITALNCLLEIFKRSGYYKAIILVPTVTLVEQWEKECRKFNFNRIVKIFAKNPLWKEDLSTICLRERLQGENNKLSYIIIATYASFSKKEAFDQLIKLPKKKVLLIADECHNMGAPKIKQKIEDIPFGRRIGLSATPERQYDVSGTNTIYKYFGASEKFTFEYPMEKAIKKKVLCEYYYFPHIVALNRTEMNAYKELTEKLAKYMTNNGADFKEDPILTMLLIKRKRIVQKATNKKGIYKQILENIYKENGSLKYTLVYVPEGGEPEYEAFDESNEEKELQHLIDEYTSIASNISPSTTVVEFTADSKDRDAILEKFAGGQIEVLTSMKCLDEGVDVPRAEYAIFCSSSGNPRQFIQRRGRILRTHPEKKYAYIHDLVVAPEIEKESEGYNVERNMLNIELKRVRNFASLSKNPTYTLNELIDIMNYYNLNLYEDETEQTNGDA